MSVPGASAFHTDRMGRNGVALEPFYEWPEYEKEAMRLVDRCERLYQSFITAGGSLSSNATTMLYITTYTLK
jgi:3-keto steroid reductase